MGNLTGKIIEASVGQSPNTAEEIGPALRRLRLFSGLTQGEVALRLKVQQAAVSKIEKGGDVHLSTVKKYVEALGASLRVDATFSADTPLTLHLRDTFDLDFADEDQLVLPLLGDEAFRPQRDVVLSIRPQYSEKILDGVKTVELRRRFPISAPKGTVAYIYSTSPVRAMVGVAEIKNVLKLTVAQIWSEFQSVAFIDKSDFDKYFAGVDYGFALIFKDVKTFSRAIPLSELREKFGFEPPQSYLYAKHDLRKALKHESAVVSN